MRETLPDQVLDNADEIQFIDISPEALRKRMRHGNIYAPEKVDTALANFFRPGNLAALREIALRLVAQTVGRARGAVRPAPQDVLVAVSGRTSSGPLIRRASRLARRFGGFCTVLVVLDREDEETIRGRTKSRQLAELLQCGFIERPGKLADAVISVARDLAVQHVVVGEAARQGVRARLHRGLVDRLIAELPDVSVHVVARPSMAPPSGTLLGQERPDSEMLLRALHASASRAGLRAYLGYARGVGTTIAMLDEASRRRQRGTDVVVAAVKTDGRAQCEGRTEGTRDSWWAEFPGSARTCRCGCVAAPQPGSCLPRRPRRTGYRRPPHHGLGPAPARRRHDARSRRSTSLTSAAPLTAWA